MNKWQLFVAAAAMTAIVVAPVVETEAATYTVQKGDTLTKIAIKHKTTVEMLTQLNNLTNHMIYAQQKLTVPKQLTHTTEQQQAVVDTPTSPTSTYKVVKGDTLSKIANNHATTVSKLKEWNQLANNTIYIGQTLKIKKGEQVTSIVENPVQNTMADQAIQNQLNKEKVNKAALTASASKQYTKALTAAKALIGTPYKFGGNTPAGIDCSGFIHYVYKQASFAVSRKSSLDYFMYDTTKVDKPIPGDVVFFKNTYIANISHMGIYLGNDQFIHAGADGVEISKLSYNYWDTRFVAFKRFNVVK